MRLFISMSGVRRQQCFEFRTWGGRRRGAGRKRHSSRPRVAHARRQDVSASTPLHVTLRFSPVLGRLRRRDRYRCVRTAMVHVTDRDDFRICHYSLQGNHLHLIVECDDRRALTRGMISFETSCARRLNRQLRRRGSVFADRYANRLTTPRTVRNALRYVINNWRHHGEDRAHPDWRTDRYSSADLFDGWSEGTADWQRPPEALPISGACSWLLTSGWRRHGLISGEEVPR
jgi:REP element-mobilizing transposase RayT